MNHIIGCGGVASWLIPKLVKLTKDIKLYDGDGLELRNLDRQLFAESDVGKNKAEALAARYALSFVPEFFFAGLFRPRPADILWCAADNHAARTEVLRACDDCGCRAVIGANEYTDAEAYWYEQSWSGSPNDPRVVYPDMATDHAGDPLAPPGCTGDAQVATPQLVLANDWASGLMLHLWWFHTQERPKLPRDTEEFWPVHHRVSAMRFSTIRKGDRK